jgi:hypothetical protein
MERIRGLINKLQQQLEQKADPAEMLGTVKVLQLELSAAANSVRQQSTSKVSVVLPTAHAVAQSVAVAEPVKPMVSEPERTYQQPVMHERITANKKHDNASWLLDPVEEIPTLAHQKEIKELNDVIGHQQQSSLNDKLKTERKELGSLLKDGPVKDLKKAIGINDRFHFLGELFRGDEAMYERSIKTINNFRIYPEAEYWIERELKVKLGWDESKPVVKHFCQLVQRRFS